ncbi:MAG: MFS transporter [Deltaproteobacteria bacterium]|nr:MFS transporter [Deltaproteobacteria bacterium]
MRSKKSFTVLIIAAGVIFIDAVGYGIVIPILPLYSRSLGATTTNIGLLFASYPLVFLMTLLPLCLVIDRYGTKYPIVFGMALLGVSSLLYAASQTLVLLMISRALQGFAAACTWAAALPLASHVTTQARRGLEMSAISIAAGSGYILGPVVGGIGNFHLPFYISALVSFGFALLCFIYLQDWGGVRGNRGENSLEKISRLLKQNEIQCSCLGVALCWAAWGMFEVLFPLYVHSFHPSRLLIGIIFGVSGFMFVICQPVAGFVSDRVGRIPPIIFGLLLLGFFVPIPLLVRSPAHLIGSTALLGLVSAFIYTPSLCLIGDVTSGDEQGVAFGLNTWMFSISYIIGPGVGGVVADMSTLQAPFLLCSVIILTGIVGILRIAGKIKTQPKVC